MSASILTAHPLALSVALDAAWPAWVIVLAVGGIVALVGFTYGAALRRSRRTLLMAALRVLAAVALLVVLLRPTLIVSREYRPRPVLTLVIDTSASMARQDVVAGGETSPSRLGAVVSRLAADNARLLGRLVDDYDVHLVAASDRVESRFAVTDRRHVPDAVAWLAKLRPEGSRTDLAESVQQVLAAGRTDRALSGLVLLTDGRRNSGVPLAATAEQLAPQRTPAIAVTAGSDEPLPDIELTDVQAPERAFVGEPVAIRGRLAVSGVAEPVGAKVALVEVAAGRPLVERSVVLQPEQETPVEFSLVHRPDKEGLSRLLVRVESPLTEPNTRNNVATVQVEAVAAKIRVLYVEDHARFEYRYLKNLLLREPMVISSCLLLSADPEFPQEGTEPIARFPATLDELDRYDVILLGDVDPAAGWINPAGLENLARWVENKGGGLAWLAGSRVDPRAWHATPLGKLLPIRPAQHAADTQPASQAFRPMLTSEGLRSPIFLLDPTGKADVPADVLIARLPEWQWAAEVGPATPAAMTLAVHPAMRTAEGFVPVIVTGRYGAGLTFYCGSDDLWRWRRFRDIEHWRSFWLQAVRMLAGPRKLGAYRPVALEAAPSRVLAGQPVALTLSVRDARLAADLPERISLVVRREGDEPPQSLWLQRLRGQATYTGSLSLDRAGTYTAEARVAAAVPATAVIAVQLPQSETSDTPADPAALHRWVQAVKDAGGDGYTLKMDELDRLASLPLPRAAVRTQVIDIRLWDNGLALVLVAGLFLAEWAWRRAKGLA